MNGVTMRVVISGCGFSGIGVAVKLKAAGINDFVILEKEGAIGGTWRDNTYPGCACDVMSHLYSFSFFPNPDWSKSYAPWSEILSYLNDCVDHFGIRPHVQLLSEVTAARFDPAKGKWCVDVCRRSPSADEAPRTEELLADFFVSASGEFSRIHIPAFSGRERFLGAQFHSARWRHDVELKGKTVAVIGTGASSIQIVPEVVKQGARRVLVFQRSPPWLMPRKDYTYPAWLRWCFRHVPLMLLVSRFLTFLQHEIFTVMFAKWPRSVAALEKVGRMQLDELVRTPEKRALCTPHYRLGCKRLLVSSEYLSAIDLPHVEILTHPIHSLSETGIITANGSGGDRHEHPVDVVIYATGFELTELSGMHPVVGLGGADLRDVWERTGQECYLGTFVHSFPNFFKMVGPNSRPAINSIVYVAECQADMITRMLQWMDARAMRRVDVRLETQQAFSASLQKALQGTVWLSGCSSWYLDRRGRCTTLWPYSTVAFWWATRFLSYGAFSFEPQEKRCSRR
jgi:cation diffusion facilitator CzcD-associated flavoprotein CzcO